MASTCIEPTVAEDYRTTNAPAQQAPRTVYLRYLLFTLYAAVYLLPFMRIYLPGTNEGILVYGAVRVVHGQVFARDFFDIMGPGSFYWLALFFKLFGVTFLATRIALFLISLGTAFSVYFLSCRMCKTYRTLPCLLLAGTYYGMQWPANGHHVDSNCFALLAVVCVVLWQEKNRNSLLLIAGAAAALTTSIHQQKGVLLFCAILLWLGWTLHRRGVASFSALGLAIAGYLGVISFVLTYFWTQGALSSLVYANFIWPSRHYGTINSVPYALGLFDQYWNHWVVAGSFRWSVGFASIMITPFLFVAAVPALSLVLGFLYGWKKVTPQMLLYWLCGWALLLSEFHRRDIYHLVFGSPLSEFRNKISDYVLQILAITSVFLATLNLMLVLTAHSVPTRVGTVAMLRVDPLFAFIDKHVAPGEEFYVYPNSPMYYFFSQTVNPTRYSNMVYNMNTTSQFEETIQILDQHKVKYVLWDANFQTKIVPQVFAEAARTPPDGFLMETYLQSHYKIATEVNGIRIMERRNDDDGH
jgi:hypothetical protein